MISFLHRWDYCWKCQLDADVKTESYYHHDGEQLLFYKKVRIKAYRKSGTWDQGVGTRDPYMGRGTWDRYIGRGTRDFSLGTHRPDQNAGPLCGNHHLGPSIWNPLPGTQDLWPYMWDQSKKTHFVYKSTVFCIVLINFDL